MLSYPFEIILIRVKVEPAEYAEERCRKMPLGAGDIPPTWPLSILVSMQGTTMFDRRAYS